MGHGDEIAIVDGNYPGQTDARGAGGLIRADGIGLMELLTGILQIMPLDEDVGHPVMMATVGGDGSSLAPIHHSIIAAVGNRAKILPMKGPDFYGRVKAAHTLVASSEPSLYANVVLRKGVIRPQS
jgi:L-fucose mutarotase